MNVQIKRALEHPRRTEILGYLVQKIGVSEKGAGEAELADALGLTGAKVKYHVTVLREADLIVERIAPARQGVDEANQLDLSTVAHHLTALQAE